MKSSVPFVSSIFFAACLLRCLCEKIASITDDAIVLVMAFINLFSLLLVIYLLMNALIGLVKVKIEMIPIYTAIKEKYIKHVQCCLNIVLFVTFFAFSYFYLAMNHYSEMSNDIISIIALGISIIQDDFNEATSEKILEFIKKKI